VVVIPGLGVYGFGKDKREARITTEFFANAVHVMAGATALEDDASAAPVLPQARTAEQAKGFKSFHNYVALPRSEAFRIEYWALEEAKLQRMPPEREFSRKIALVVGGGSGIGREVALLLARLGAHVVVADRDEALAGSTWTDAQKLSSPETGMAARVDLSSAAVSPRCGARFWRLAASTSSSTRRQSIRHPIRLGPTPKPPGRTRCTSTSRVTTCWPKRRRGCYATRICRRRWCSPARRTRSCPRAAAKRTTSAKPR
jgi:hypothetical protein